MPQAEAIEPMLQSLPETVGLPTDALDDKKGPTLELVEANAPAKQMSIVETWTRLLVGLIWFSLTTVGFACIMLLFLPHRPTRIRLGNIYGSWAGKGAVWLTGSKITVTGHAEATAQRPAIYVTNHASLIDIFLGIWLSPISTCGIGKKEVVFYPFFGQIFWLAGQLMIDRSNREKAVTSLKELAPYVRKHCLSIMIWPEGHRARDGRLQAFKKGVAHLAISTGLPIIPMVVSGAHLAWPSDSLRMHRAKIGVRFLAPVSTKDWQTETIEKHLHQLEELFIAALPSDQRPLDS